MLKKKIILVAACVVLIAAAVVVVNAFVKKNPESVAESVAEDVTAQQEAETKVADKHAGQVQSVISGKWESAEDGANVPVAVMYSNIEQAMPQSNISKADVVFESLV
jgi:predicted secreted protein